MFGPEFHYSYNDRVDNFACQGFREDPILLKPLDYRMNMVGHYLACVQFRHVKTFLYFVPPFFNHIPNVIQNHFTIHDTPK